MTISVSLYCNEYVERLEQDRDRLLWILDEIGAYYPNTVRVVNQPMPPRRGVSQIQDGPKWK